MDAGLVEKALGGAPYTVRVAGVTVPADALALVSIVRGRNRPDQRPDAPSCTLVIATERVTQLPNVGDAVEVDLSAEARTYLGAMAAGAAPVKRFRGKVTDATASSTGTVSGPARLTVVATGARARLLPLKVGAGAWPQEDDYSRAARILTEAQAQDSSLVAGVSDAGTVTVLARDPGTADAGSLLDELAVSSGGELVELRDGSLAWHDANHRRNLAPTLTLAAGNVLSESAQATQQLAGLVNDLTLSYGAGGAASVRVVDTVSADPVAGYGPVPLQLATILTSEAAAGSRANDLVGRYSLPRWRMEKLATDLLRTVPAALATQLVALEFGQLVQLQGFPNTGPFTAAQLFVEGQTEAATRNAWTLALNVADKAYTAGAPLWADLGTQTVLRFRSWRARHERWFDLTPATGPSWADLAANEPDLTWLGAAGWDVDSTTTARWLDQPADLSWLETDPTTWAAFTGL